MYRRPKSLDALLQIRSAMSEEVGHDMSAFVEMIRTGVHPEQHAKTVTRETGGSADDPQATIVVPDPIETIEERRP